MAKNKANGVSLKTFGEHYHRVLKSGGDVKDLMISVEMENVNSVRQKIVALKKAFPNLPSLARQGRTPNGGETAAQAAANRLAELFAEDVKEVESVETETADKEMATV